MRSTDGLLVVDVQNDFCPGGALAVPHGDHVAKVMTEYAGRFHEEGLPIFASRDWHPPQTKHFQQWGGPWVPHCVQNTTGAAFHPALRLPDDAIIVSKGDDFEGDSYSAFLAHGPSGHSLSALLREKGVKRLFIGGLATDYCVRASALDALEKGFEVVLLLDAMSGIDVEAGDTARALDEMLRAGAGTAVIGTAGIGLRE